VGLLQQAAGGPEGVFWAIGGAAIVAALTIGSLGMPRVGSATKAGMASAA
jgi:AAHS family 4-hydroxybenzoate transporter-like MFS transporter